MINEEILKNALIEAGQKINLPLTKEVNVIDHSKDPSLGEYASNIAMRLARIAK